MICARCSKETYELEMCEYCRKMVCRLCEKSSKRIKKLKRIVICKDCWGDMKKRNEFKKY